MPKLNAQDSPTLTAVLLSSSEALLPPSVGLLDMLRRLLLRGAGLAMALKGRAGILPGDAGGELAMAQSVRKRRCDGER